MHILTLQEPVNLGKTLGLIEAGSWVLHDINAFEIARLAPRGKAQIQSYEAHSLTLPSDPVLVMRSGAIGDLLLLLPALKELWFQGAKPIHLCCFKHHFDIFSGCKFIEELVPYPLPAGSINDYSEIISLENIMECDHSRHATDVFASALGVKGILPSYRPDYSVSEAEAREARQIVFKDRPTIAVHTKASVSNRNYPLPLWLEAIKKLEQRGWGILLLGQKGQIPDLPPNLASPFIKNLAEMGLTFRQSAAVLAECDAFCGVDSAWAHMCHALDIPAVVLFAAFDWKTRTSKAPKTIALTGVGECAPCNWHIHAGREFPPNKPCSSQRICTVIAGISPDRIVQKVSLLKP